MLLLWTFCSLKTFQPIDHPWQGRATRHFIKCKALTIPRIPALKPGALPKPYVETLDGIARTNAGLLLDNHERLKPNQIRKIEDPVKLQDRKMQVRYGFSNLCSGRVVNDAIIPNSTLDRGSHVRHGHVSFP